ncbi:MAG TPA: oligosaccharide flippase family protein [Paludibacteraceae bacterium]|nr:oligosaccharide flippase family protein [Paludibacteraceae bacterium]
MGSAKNVASGVVWSTLVNLINAIYGFISVPILINYFGKAEYGIIGLAMSVNVYMQLMDLGFNSTNVRFFSNWLAKKDWSHTNKLFQTSLAFYGVIGILNALALILVSFFTKELFHLSAEQDVILKNLLYILSVSAIVSWFVSCFSQLISATENVAWIQRYTLLPKLLQLAILFITVFSHLSILWYFLLTTFSLFSIIPFYMRKISKETPFVKFLPKFDKKTFKEIIPYCLNIFSFSIFQFSFYNLRPVFLGIQGSVESVADYRVLNGVITVVSIFGSSFMGVLLPSAAKVVATHNKEAFYKIAYDGTKYITIVLCFCCFGMMTICSEVLELYVGKSFLYLIPWLHVWLVCTLGVHIQAISSLILSGSDIRTITYSTVVASITGLLISWFAIPYYQVGGVVMAFVVYQIVQLVFYYFYYWRVKMNISSWRVFSYSFIPYVILGAALYFIINQFVVFDASNWILLFVKGILFSVIYLFFILFLLTDNDKMYFRSLIKS